MADDRDITDLQSAPHTDPAAAVLLESRQRWRDLVTLVAELVFETDPAGRIAFAAPEHGFGIASAALLGTDAERLFAEPPPLALQALRGEIPSWRGRVWLQRRDGGQSAALLSIAALSDAAGGSAGARAALVDLGAEEAREAARAAALRQADTLRRLLDAVIELPPAQTGIDVALAMLKQEINADAIEVLPLGVNGEVQPATAAVGTSPAAGGHTILQRLEHRDGREGLRTTLLRAWRAGTPFTPEARGLIRAMASSLCALLERESLAQVSRSAALIDGITGFWTMGSFAEELARRFDRLDVEGAPGTLLLLGFGAQLAPAAIDNVAAALADELRDSVRPTDLLGRLRGDVIGLWCDGMDHLTGAERAARFCTRLPAALPGGQMISAGLVSRWPGSGDDGPSVIERASAALHEAEQAGGGTWRLWQAG